MAEKPDLSPVSLRLRRPVYDYHQYQGYTNDCGPTCVAIAANALLEEERFEGPVVAEEMSRVAFEWTPVPHLVVQRVPGWATFPRGIVYYLRKHGFQARWRPFGKLEKLDSNVRADRITMVILGEPWRWEDGSYKGWGHVKILFGHVPGQRLLFVDPGYARSSDEESLEYHGLFWEEEEEFVRLWRNYLRIYVEVEKRPGVI